MKCTLSLLFLLGILCSSCHQKVKTVDWRHFGESKGGSVFYYDPARISHPTKDIVGVWVMEIPSESENIYTLIITSMEARGMAVPEDLRKCEQYTYSVVLYEVDCSEQTIIPIASEDFDEHGNLLYSCANERETVTEGINLGGFDATIASETVWDTLYQAVCRR